MSTGIIVGIVVAVIVIGAVVFGVMAVLRRRRLQQRFGPEYDRLVGERDSRRKAEAELTGRERRVEGLDIQPLTDVGAGKLRGPVDEHPGAVRRRAGGRCIRSATAGRRRDDRTRLPGRT